MTAICNAIMQQTSRHVHLVSIDVKSEGSILLKEIMIHSHCKFKELDAELHTSYEKNCYYIVVHIGSLVSHKGCGL